MLALDDDPLSPPTPPAQRPAVHMPWSLRLREWVLGYLPLLLMALLALATWWLVKSTPNAPAPGSDPTLRHVPDYTMQGFKLQRFTPQGALQVQIEGTQMRHYPDNDTFEVDEVRIRSLAEDGTVMRATARRALSDGKGTQVRLMGNAVVVREARDGQPPLEIRSELLTFFTDTERVVTDQPVQVLQGSNDMRAAGVDYDHRSGQAKLTGPMRARLDPPGRRR